MSHTSIVRHVACLDEEDTPTLLFLYWNGDAIDRWCKLEKLTRGKLTFDNKVRVRVDPSFWINIHGKIWSWQRSFVLISWNWHLHFGVHLPLCTSINGCIVIYIREMFFRIFQNGITKKVLSHNGRILSNVHWCPSALETSAWLKRQRTLSSDVFSNLGIHRVSSCREYDGSLKLRTNNNRKVLLTLITLKTLSFGDLTFSRQNPLSTG